MDIWTEKFSCPDILHELNNSLGNSNILAGFPEERGRGGGQNIE